MSNTSQFVLVVPDDTLPYSRTLAAGTGLSLQDTGAGQDITIVPANLLGSIQGLGTTGILVNTNQNTAINRSVTSTDGTVTVNNGNGVAGNIDLGINDDTTNQRVFIWENGTPITSSGALDFYGANVQYDSGTNSCKISITGGGGGSPTNATYILQTPNGVLNNAQSLSTLSTGLLKNTTSTGVLSTAVAGTDYVAPNANLTAISGLAVTKGSILVANGTAITEIGVGTDGQILTAASGQATGVQWANNSALTNPMTTAGDLIVGGSGGAANRLGIGTSGQILTVSGGVSAWATPANWSASTATSNVNFGNYKIVNTNNINVGFNDGTIGNYALTLSSNASNAQIYMGSSSVPSITGNGIVLSCVSNNLLITNEGGSYSPFGNPMTTAGDLIIGGTSGAPARLPIGSNGQFLNVSSGGVVQWATPANWSTITASTNANLGGSAIVNTSKINLGYGDNTNGYYDINLSGNNGTAQIFIDRSPNPTVTGNGIVLSSNNFDQLTFSNSSGSFVALGNPMTTAGDLIVGGSGGAAGRLGIGTSGQILTVSGGVPAWTTPSTGTVIGGTATLDGTGTVTVTDSNISSSSVVVGSYLSIGDGETSVPLIIVRHDGYFVAGGIATADFSWMVLVP